MRKLFQGGMRGPYPDPSAEHVDERFPLQVFRELSKAVPSSRKRLAAIGILLLLDLASLVVTCTHVKTANVSLADVNTDAWRKAQNVSMRVPSYTRPMKSLSALLSLLLTCEARTRVLSCSTRFTDDQDVEFNISAFIVPQACLQARGFRQLC